MDSIAKAVGNKLVSFETALAMLKGGSRVQRIGWNGKGMWLRLIAADDYQICRPAEDFTSKVETLPLLPWIGMKTADNKFVPWLASQTDILADDWQVVQE